MHSLVWLGTEDTRLVVDHTWLLATVEMMLDPMDPAVEMTLGPMNPAVEMTLGPMDPAEEMTLGPLDTRA